METDANRTKDHVCAVCGLEMRDQNVSRVELGLGLGLDLSLFASFWVAQNSSGMIKPNHLLIFHTHVTSFPTKQIGAL